MNKTVSNVLRSSGTNIWAITAGGAQNENGQGIAMGPSNTAYVTGTFGAGAASATATFGTSTLTNTGSALEGSYFVAKVDLTLAVTELSSNDQAVVIYPNPASENVSVILGKAFEKNNSTVNVFDVTGKLVASSVLNKGQSTQFTIDTHSLVNGIYIVSVQSDETNVTKRLVVSH